MDCRGMEAQIRYPRIAISAVDDWAEYNFLSGADALFFSDVQFLNLWRSIVTRQIGFAKDDG